MLLVIAFMLGFLSATIVAGLVWIHLLKGYDKPLTYEEVQELLKKHY